MMTSLPRRAVLVAVLLTACAPGSREPGRQSYVFRGATMGTYYVVKVAAEGLSEGRLGELQAVIEGELEDVNGKMSTYIEDSELSRFNRHTDTAPFAVSAATFDVMSAALEVAKLSGGAYDVTVGPLVNAWGFGAEAGRPDLDAAAVAELRERVGYDLLELDAERRTSRGMRASTKYSLRKLHPDLYCDLSSIAKGYAVDRVAEALLAEGLGDVWVEVGGEVRAAGRNADGVAWRLGIERPDSRPGALQRIVPLADAAVATSGDYRNYRERDGERFSHIIDPRSGWPIRHRLASVTVVAERCMRADALSTALLVLGPEEGWQLALREGLAVLFLVRDGDGFAERITPEFETLTRPEADGKP